MMVTSTDSALVRHPLLDDLLQLFDNAIRCGATVDLDIRRCRIAANVLLAWCKTRGINGVIDAGMLFVHIGHARITVRFEPEVS
jgi:hypothetical protein